MTFVELYGDELDTELGSADRTERFTNARRRSAINFAQREFVRLTDSFTREGEIVLTTTIGEYDLEALLDADTFLRFADQQPYITIVTSGGDTRTLQGRDFARLDIPALDREDSGWRNVAASTPVGWYLREDGGEVKLGLQPAPSIPAGDTWTLYVPYVAYPADMVNDTDEPFSATAGGNTKSSLVAYHKALAHRAAAELEKLRRNYDQVKAQLQTFMGYIQDYQARLRKTGGERISYSHSYLQDANRGHSWVRPEDPWR